MEKIIYQDSNDALLSQLEQNGEQLVTLIETDTGVKSAASNVISRDLMEKYRPDKNNALIHLIAMSDSRQFGFNKNGDWFDGDVLKKTANTFVTHGHVFKEHRNRHPDQKIGLIKYAAYNPEMHRVELLIHMDKTLSPKSYEMAKQGNALSFSMSCRVPNDRCSCCGNKAKVVSQYCSCLKSNMGKWMPDFEKYAFAFNDEPVFFDISEVANPADRIARHLEYMFDGPLQKSASVAYQSGDILIPSAIAAQAEGLTLPGFALDEQLVLSKLASSEEFIADTANADRFYMDKRANVCYGSYPFALLSPLSAQELEAARGVQPSTLFHELTKKSCVLSFPAFCQYVTGKENIMEAPLFKKAAFMLPTIFRDMMGSMSSMCPCTDMFRCGSSTSVKHDAGHGDLVQNMMNTAEEKFSIGAEPVKRRVMTIIIKAGSDNADRLEVAFNKAASVNADPNNAYNLAQTYGQYQLRALCDIRERHGNDSINDNTYDLIAGANSVLVFDR